MKTDARIRYTKKVIHENFFQLLKEKPITKITVKELCDRCEINRATFYNHYKDPFDLLEQIEEEILVGMDHVLSQDQFKDMISFYTKILTTMKDSNHWISTISSVHGDTTFTSKIFIKCYHLFFPQFSSRLNSLDEATQKLVYYFLTNGCSGIMHYWLKSGMKESPETIARFLDSITTNIIKAYTI